MGKIRIGVSGWSYQDWRGHFYPETVTRVDELRYAAGIFDTIEVNGTFYSLSTPDAFRSWHSAAPSGFVFAVKGSRYITHSKKLNRVETPLANFFASGILDLGSKLGPVLWQLPASLHFDAERVNRFLGLLPKDTIEASNLAGRHDDKVKSISYGSNRKHRLRHVLEIRHESYLSDELVRIARDHGVALAFSHASTWPYLEELTAGFAYVRLHGPGEPYRSPYGDAIKVWARKLRAWHRGSEPEEPQRISDRVPPRRKERDVYVYLDNDAGGHAPKEAQALRFEVDRLLE
ncbi:MAG: DUF72 domain-containing protein [Acidimicrobiia bacterium]|nr:DUF72 domain-containing protein [Acidimicrobiia bacterium]